MTNKRYTGFWILDKQYIIGINFPIEDVPWTDYKCRFNPHRRRPNKFFKKKTLERNKGKFLVKVEYGILSNEPIKVLDCMKI